MAQIFISYSRTDRAMVDQLVPLIRRVYGDDSLWYADDIQDHARGQPVILAEIANCDLFVFLVSSKSLESTDCQTELREALRLQKPILPVIITAFVPGISGPD